MPEQEFSTAAVKEILGIPQRTLDYWDERNVVRPSLQQAKGKGTERKYSYSDLVELSVVKGLRDTGLSLQRIRKGLAYLRRFKNRPEQDIVFVTDGKDLFEKKKGDKLVSVLRGGQMALSVVFLGRIPIELDASIKKFDAEREKRQSAKRAKSA